METKIELAAQAFKALADPTRLRLLKALLSIKVHRGICVCELVDALGLPQYQVSRQLGQLKGTGWLQSERRGTWIYYRVAEALEPWRAGVMKALADLQGESFQADETRLRRRLTLRKEGLCVVGYEASAIT